jgi:uncharacterized DUF497 family protein
MGRMFLWLDDPGGNVEHVAEHGLTTEEIESAFDDVEVETTSRATGRPALFGRTFKGDTVFVVYDLETDADGHEFVYVRTAYITED